MYGKMKGSNDESWKHFAGAANIVNDDDAHVYRDVTRMVESPRETTPLFRQSGLTSPQTNPFDDSDFEPRSDVQITSYNTIDKLSQMNMTFNESVDVVDCCV